MTMLRKIISAIMSFNSYPALMLLNRGSENKGISILDCEIYPPKIFIATINTIIKHATSFTYIYI